MKGGFILGIIICLVLASCAQNNALPPEPSEALRQEIVQEPIKEIIIEEEEKENLSSVEEEAFFDIQCNKEDSSIRFKMRNPTSDWVWLIDPSVSPMAYGQYKDRADPIVILMNDYKINDDTRPVSYGEKLFGPKDGFKANCGGVIALEPGEELECFFQPIKILTKTKLASGENILELSGTSKYERVVLDCK